MARLNKEQIEDSLAAVPGWEIVSEGGMDRLNREFSFGNFAEALEFTNKVGQLAEDADHHPRIVTEWGSVVLTWWSHSEGGIVAGDFEMAKKVDAI